MTAALGTADRAVSAAPPVSAAPLLSIVVLSYDRPACLRRSLASLAAQPLADREILVVDNLSPSSEEVASVVAGVAGARLIPLPANLGFTGGMNAGIAQSAGRHVLLTEDDIVLEPGCLEALLAQAEATAHQRILTGVMLEEGTRRVRSAGGEVALGPPFRMRVTGAGDDVATLDPAPYEVSYAPGAFLLLPRAALQALGGFRGDFFMYMEDVELCLRARRAGIGITVVPAARITHLPAAAGTVTTALEYHKVKNLLATYLLHAPYRAFPSVALRYGVLEAPRRLAEGIGGFAAFARAWLWLLVHTPGLLRDRLALRRALRGRR